MPERLREREREIEREIDERRRWRSVIVHASEAMERTCHCGAGARLPLDARAFSVHARSLQIFSFFRYLSNSIRHITIAILSNVRSTCFASILIFRV